MAQLPTSEDLIVDGSNDMTTIEDDFEGITGGNSSSSEDESGVLMSKEMKQLLKMQMQINKNLCKIESIQNKFNNKDLHCNEETQFEILLIKINDSLAKLTDNNLVSNNIKVDLKSLRKEKQQINKLFVANKKIWKMSMKEDKLRKKEQKMLSKLEKQLAKEIKKEEKLRRKEEKLAIKKVKQFEKEERKQVKLKFLETLEKARIEELPNNVNDLNNLELWIDGWNISGCFGGRSRSKNKLINLLQFYHNLNEDLLKNIELFYDGNGANKLNGNINISHSGKSIIVDDLWIELLSKMNNVRKNNILCITSDRELTVRLYNIGVKVMKSGKFFKTYLKPILEENKKENENENKNETGDNDIVMVKHT